MSNPRRYMIRLQLKGVNSRAKALSTRLLLVMVKTKSAAALDGVPPMG